MSRAKPLDTVRRVLLPLLAAYVRHAPEHPGLWRLTHLATRWAPLLRETRRTRIVTLREGFKLHVDGRSQTGRIAYATGSYEPAATALMKSAVAAGETVVDVGANIGYFTLVASRAVTPTGRVVAFEPVPAVRQALEANLRINGVDNVTLHPDALGPSAGEVRFFCGPEGDSGLGSLRALDEGREIVVHQVRFDDLPAPDSRVSLIKIDVEGAELQALRGMRQCLTRDRPAVIIEVTDSYLRAMGDSAADLFAFFDSLGYRMFHMRDEGALTPIDNLNSLARCPSQFNAYCTPR